MPDIKIGDNTLTGVSELQCVNADDTTQHVIFYSAPRAILAVTAPAGSTIDVLQNSIVLQTYTLGAAETSHSFKVDVSTTNYVVRASLLDKVKNKTVAVTAATTYNITIEYSRLPAGYIELEYLESSGTQYIETNAITNENNTLNIVFIPKASITTICGNLTIDYCANSVAPNAAGVNTALKVNQKSSLPNYTINQEYTLTVTPANVKLNSTTYSYVSDSGNGQGGKLSLFMTKWGSSQKYGIVAIENLRMTNSGGTLLTDLIPARRISDNTLGMYDMVTNTLFTNAGSGSFIAGPEV